VIAAIRALARFLTFLLLVALALTGLMIAIFSIASPDSSLSLPALARDLQLPEAREHVGDWLDQLERNEGVDWWSLLGGVSAMVLGLLLIAGILIPARERLVTLEESDAGRLAARKRPLAQAAAALSERQRGVLEARVKVRPSRLGEGGKMKVRASRPRSVSDAEVEERVRAALTPLAESFRLRTRVRTDEGARVQ
jgi:hypothetical protein